MGDEKRYGKWSGRPNGVPMDHARCIASVWPGRSMIESQCSRKRGHGKDGLYCKQHGKTEAHRDDALAALRTWDAGTEGGGSDG